MKQITGLELRSNKRLAIVYRQWKELRRMLRQDNPKDEVTELLEGIFKMLEDIIMKFRLSPEGVEKLHADHRKKLEERRAREGE